MTWPTDPVDTTGMDAGTDTPPRTTFLSWAQKFNQLIAHVSSFMQGLLGSADAAAARATLNVPTRTGSDASGTWGISISGNAATASAVTNGVTTVGDQSIGGVKTFTSQVNGSAGFKASGGADIQLQAGTGNDAGDLLFLSSAGSEIGRIWRDAAADQFFVRFSSGDSTKVLTHNQNFGVHSAALAVGAVGTYALLKEDNTTNRVPGDTVAGSSLQYSTASGAFPSVINPSGTWRCMGYKWGGGGSADRVTEWLRIS